MITFFNFVNQFLTTIGQGISDTISIISSFINLLIYIFRILPDPLYPCFLTFIGLYTTIFIYKLIRQG